jgi:hypothetical protein
MPNAGVGDGPLEGPCDGLAVGQNAQVSGEIAAGL